MPQFPLWSMSIDQHHQRGSSQRAADTCAMPKDLGDPAHPISPSNIMWIPWESRASPVISMVLRAAGGGCGLWGGRSDLGLAADAEVSAGAWLRLCWGSAGITCTAQGFASSCETARRVQLVWCQALAYQPC